MTYLNLFNFQDKNYFFNLWLHAPDVPLRVEDESLCPEFSPPLINFGEHFHLRMPRWCPGPVAHCTRTKLTTIEALGGDLRRGPRNNKASASIYPTTREIPLLASYATFWKFARRAGSSAYQITNSPERRPRKTQSYPMFHRSGPKTDPCGILQTNLSWLNGWVIKLIL